MNGPAFITKWHYGFSWQEPATTFGEWIAMTNRPPAPLKVKHECIVKVRVGNGQWICGGCGKPMPDKPKPDWRDVPVTAGMLVDACVCSDSVSTDYLADHLEAIAKRKVGPQETFLDEASRKGGP